jgi:uncharacterized protein YegP (UPF0339 family)
MSGYFFALIYFSSLKTKKMSSTHKSDDYNLFQKSQSGNTGFEPFKGEDGRHYFHFNDKTGAALLYSQAYQKSAERDSGIKSVKKNAVIKARYEILSEGDKHYFVLRAGNKFAIGRSRFFKNKADMEAHKLFLSNYFIEESDEKSVLANVSNAPAHTILTSNEPLQEAVSAFKNAENDALQRRIAELEMQIEQFEKSKMDISDIEKTEMPRQVFRIEIYKNDTSKRFHGKIIHPLTTDTRAFSGVDIQTIEQFMHEVINIKIEKTEKTPIVQASVVGEISSAINETTTPHEVSRVISADKQTQLANSGKSFITARNPFNGSGAIEQNMPFELTIEPMLKEGENLLVGENYWIKIYVFSFATREHFILLERALVYKANGQNILKTNVHQNALPNGSHRLTVMISEPNPSVNPTLKYFEGKTWHGEAIIQMH